MRQSKEFNTYSYKNKEVHCEFCYNELLYIFSDQNIFPQGIVDRPIEAKKYDYNIYICPKCGLIHKINSCFEYESDYYSKFNLFTVNKKQMPITFDLIKRCIHFKNNMLICDIGGFNHKFLDGLKEINTNYGIYILIDPVLKSLKMFSNNNSLFIEIPSSYPCKEIDGLKFDLISARSLLEVVPFSLIKSILEGVYKQLKDDGVLLVETPNFYEIEAPFYFTLDRHFEFMEETMILILEKYGFEFVNKNISDYLSIIVKKSGKSIEKKEYGVESEKIQRAISKLNKLKNLKYELKEKIDNLDKKIIIWGAGANISETYHLFDQRVYKIVDIDKNKEGLYVPGYSGCIEHIEVLANLDNKNDIVIYINSFAQDEILETAKQMGYKNFVKRNGEVLLNYG